ncbi:hypothetical protein [Tsukamurella strandjordii]|uniref:hypothetical protein n=1 Tax=Tsukamurella strandjordii TaxID=147577 RepID=UPI0031DD0E2E
MSRRRSTGLRAPLRAGAALAVAASVALAPAAQAAERSFAPSAVTTTAQLTGTTAALSAASGRRPLPPPTDIDDVTWLRGMLESMRRNATFLWEGGSLFPDHTPGFNGTVERMRTALDAGDAAAAYTWAVNFADSYRIAFSSFGADAVDRFVPRIGPVGVAFAEAYSYLRLANSNLVATVVGVPRILLQTAQDAAPYLRNGNILGVMDVLNGGAYKVGEFALDGIFGSGRTVSNLIAAVGAFGKSLEASFPPPASVVPQSDPIPAPDGVAPIPAVREPVATSTSASDQIEAVSTANDGVTAPATVDATPAATPKGPAAPTTQLDGAASSSTELPEAGAGTGGATKDAKGDSPDATTAASGAEPPADAPSGSTD